MGDPTKNYSYGPKIPHILFTLYQTCFDGNLFKVEKGIGKLLLVWHVFFYSKAYIKYCLEIRCSQVDQHAFLLLYIHVFIKPKDNGFLQHLGSQRLCINTFYNCLSVSNDRLSAQILHLQQFPDILRKIHFLN